MKSLFIQTLLFEFGWPRVTKLQLFTALLIEWELNATGKSNALFMLGSGLDSDDSEQATLLS
jgi:hypothetical protein